MAKKKRFLFISAFFPNKNEPNIATYNRQQLHCLADDFNIDAIVPIPWKTRIRSKGIWFDNLDSINIYHPTYYYTPLILRKFYGYFYFLSVTRTINKLLNKNKYDFVYSSWLYPDAWAAHLVARKLNLPLFVSVLGSDVNRLKPKDEFIQRSLEVGSYASKIICVSNALKERLVALGFERSKLIYLQNGVDKNIFYPGDKSKIRDGMGYTECDKVFLFVGNLKKEKGLQELVEAFSSLLENFDHGKTLLWIVGVGAFCEPLKRIVAALDISNNVKFLGEKTPEEIAELMNACDVFCLPSYSEGQPNVVIEALSCQAKVVSTNVGGIPELDTGENNLELVEPQNVLALKRALSVMLERDQGAIQWQDFNSWRENAMVLYDVFSSCSLEREHNK